ncbi:helix-turn-helix transcriptional regulator [Oscillatoria sp. FACHB-1407]|uniref:helix-turn-helix domain-containing protein n=1 Tax=Oscillatoria sp. FACHB-1407 TaxID=2692847 RepID=UPI001687AA6D|nr:AraC family transcriptional regulator [Oscillatoria sp. FACHB-1407]MBD2463637.1 helix-turn-helix transcriptional regulator [Oscillatoria sp. FACHB-1407]
MAVSQSSNAQNSESPIFSSLNLDWETILLEEYRQPSGGTTLAAEADLVIVLSLSTQPHRIYQQIGDRHHIGLYHQGDLCITPSGIPSGYQAEGDDHYLYAQIPSRFLQQVVEEALELNLDRVEVVPTFQSRNPQLEQLLRLLQAELHQDGRMGRLYVESLTNALVVNLLRDYSTTQPHITQYDGGLGDRKLLQVTHYINEALDQDIKLADLAQLAGVSQSHFSRLFKRSMGLSPHQYLLQQRVERAKQLLKNTNQSLVEIALACGFDSHSHFTRQFRHITGLTPKAYRAH